MKRIAIYGKGGIGKSTTVSNLSALLAQQGLTVLQVGCDPKADSTICLRGDAPLTPILETYRTRLQAITLDEMVVQGRFGIYLAEAGGPTPGLGCAGRGVAKALDLLSQKHAFEELHPDVVFYDVLGDVVCGGFSMPLRRTYSDRVFVISSGEAMSIHAAMNLGLAAENFKRRGHNGLSGVIGNLRNVPDEQQRLITLAEDLECPLVGTISRSLPIESAAAQDKTLLEADPLDPAVKEYEQLAAAILAL